MESQPASQRETGAGETGPAIRLTRSFAPAPSGWAWPRETTASPPLPLLQLKGGTIRFGGLTAVSDLDLEIGGHELIGLIGPNGAGKTTVFNLITGVYQPSAGEILFNGETLIGLKPHQITARGIARTFQNIRLFASLTVFDNVRVAFNLHLASGAAHALGRGRAFQREERDIADQVMEMLEIFKLGQAIVPVQISNATFTVDELLA